MRIVKLLPLLVVLARGCGAMTPVFAQEPAAKMSCKRVREDWTIVDGKTGKSHDEENWEVSCTVTMGNALIWSGKLPMAHPATDDEAYKAEKEFRKERAPELVKKYLASKQ